MYMNVCVYIYIYTYMHIHIYICIHVYIIQNDDAFHCATTSFGTLGIIFSLVLEVCKYI